MEDRRVDFKPYILKVDLKLVHFAMKQNCCAKLDCINSFCNRIIQNLLLCAYAECGILYPPCFRCVLIQFICVRFLWMVRIGGGVFPVIKEPDYLANGEYRVDKGATPKMLNCLM